MQTAPLGKIVFVCCSIVLAMSVNGCAVGGKSFSMDSNSRVPFFGLELRERKAKSSSPAFSTISRAASDQARVDLVVQASSQGSKAPLVGANGRFSAQTVIDEPVKASIVPSSAAKTAATSVSGPHSISLPIDEMTKSEPVRTASTSAIDFH